MTGREITKLGAAAAVLEHAKILLTHAVGALLDALLPGQHYDSGIATLLSAEIIEASRLRLRRRPATITGSHAGAAAPPAPIWAAAMNRQRAGRLRPD